MPPRPKTIEEINNKIRNGDAVVVTAEENNIIGGLGSAVAEALAEGAARRVPLKRIGVADTFGESGTPDELLEKHGLTVNNIAATATALVERG